MSFVVRHTVIVRRDLCFVPKPMRDVLPAREWEVG